MYTKLTRRSITIVLVIALSLLVVGTVVMASGVLRPIDPSAPSNAVGIGDALIAAHITLPPPDVTYVAFSQGRVEPPGDRPVAVFGEQSAKLAEPASAFYPDLSDGSVDQGNQIVLTILSSIKYTSGNDDILVTTTKLSAAAAAKSLYLGEKKINLASGITAWATEYAHGDFPNRVIFIVDDLLITVASDLPIKDVQSLAADIVVMYP